VAVKPERIRVSGHKEKKKMVQKKLPVILYSLNKVRGCVHSSPTDGAQGTLPDIRNKRLPSVLADFGSDTSNLLLPLGTTFFLKYTL